MNHHNHDFLHNRNGTTRCGLMICVYNALDKLKLEQQIDVYCPVLKARLRRPPFIANIVSSLACSHKYPSQSGGTLYSARFFVSVLPLVSWAKYKLNNSRFFFIIVKRDAFLLFTQMGR